jgi:hypothetical protein
MQAPKGALRDTVQHENHFVPPLLLWHECKEKYRMFICEHEDTFRVECSASTDVHARGKNKPSE